MSEEQTSQYPLRGEVWLANLNPTQGHEQRGIRPVLVISDNRLNRGPSELTIVLPITSVQRRIPSHLWLNPPEGRLRTPSSILCDAIRSIDRGRLMERWGTISIDSLAQVEEILRYLLVL